MQSTAEDQVSTLQARYLDAVAKELRRVVPPGGLPRDEDIHAVLRYHLGWEEEDGSPSSTPGGKALRPVLCLMACEMAGGAWHAALPAAVFLELIHNFSLLHDDIQDNDATRRGRATAWTIWGVPKAVAAGNAMRVLADRSLHVLAESALSAGCTVTAAQVLTRRYMEMIEGQYLDVSFEESNKVSTNAYLDMIGRKTGALIESSMFAGALVATGDPEVAGAFGECGRGLGIAFQVRDDYLGVWGDPEKTGKPVGADIRRKKKSLPVVHVFQQAGKDNLKRLERVYAQPEVDSAGVELVLEMMETAGTPAYVRETAEACSRAALLPLGRLGLPGPALERVQAMAEYFVTRDK